MGKITRRLKHYIAQGKFDELKKLTKEDLGVLFYFKHIMTIVGSCFVHKKPEILMWTLEQRKHIIEDLDDILSHTNITLSSIDLIWKKYGTKDKGKDLVDRLIYKMGYPINPGHSIYKYLLKNKHVTYLQLFEKLMWCVKYSANEDIKFNAVLMLKSMSEKDVQQILHKYIANEECYRVVFLIKHVYNKHKIMVQDVIRKKADSDLIKTMLHFGALDLCKEFKGFITVLLSDM